MKSSDLHKVWSAPDNSRLTAKQYSFRLPVQVAAKLFALCDIYPNKTRTDLVGDLLAAAIEEAISGLPVVKGGTLLHESDGDLCQDVGPYEQFRVLANTHFQELERELGTASPAELYECGRLVRVD